MAARKTARYWDTVDYIALNDEPGDLYAETIEFYISTQTASVATGISAEVLAKDILKAREKDQGFEHLTGGLTKEDRAVPYALHIKSCDYASLTKSPVKVFFPGEDAMVCHLLNKFDDGDGDFSYSLVERAVAVPASWIAVDPPPEYF